MVGKELPAAFYYGLLANAAPASIAIRYGFMGPCSYRTPARRA